MVKKNKKPNVLKYSIILLAIVVAFQGIYLYANGPTGEAVAITNITITNAVPALSSMLLNDAGGASTDITLRANDTVNVSCTATITDNNGCEDIVVVNGSLYVENNTTSTGPLRVGNNHTIYYNSTCKLSGCTGGGGDLTVEANCTFVMRHFAIATDANANDSQAKWECRLEANDTQNAVGNLNTSVHVNTLSSIELINTTGIKFGSLALGANTSGTDNKTNLTVANTGNERLDLNVRVYGALDGDNWSMECASGNITDRFMRYHSSPFKYLSNETGSNNSGNGTAAVGRNKELDFNLTIGSQTTPAPSSFVFFQMGLPTQGVGGNCNGSIVVTAVSDPAAD